jgi:hypothetical protein
MVCTVRMKIALSILLSLCNGYDTGAPNCDVHSVSIMKGTNVDTSNSAAWEIAIDSKSLDDKLVFYLRNLNLEKHHKSEKFLGFLIYAEDADGERHGVFTESNNARWVKHKDCNDGTTLTHRNSNEKIGKHTKFIWSPPTKSEVKQLFVRAAIYIGPSEFFVLSGAREIELK